MKRFCFVFVSFACLAASLFAQAGVYPDPQLTPGDFMRDADGKLTGRPKGKTADIRNVTAAEAKTIFDSYKIPEAHRNGTDYEIDHFISLVLGGSNDPKNLWPQTRDRSIEWNAWEKDKLEAQLMRLLDEHEITIEEAQNAIKTDWVAAYEKYMPMAIKGVVHFVEDSAHPAYKEPTTPYTKAAATSHKHYVPKKKTSDDPDEALVASAPADK